MTFFLLSEPHALSVDENVCQSSHLLERFARRRARVSLRAFATYGALRTTRQGARLKTSVWRDGVSERPSRRRAARACPRVGQ